MKIALIGYGKMGKVIEQIAIEQGHKIVLIVDQINSEDLTPHNLQKADVAIEFTTPHSARENISRCFHSGIPVVSGTTGWVDGLEEIKKKCGELNGTFFYASNFSLGVNILFKVNNYLARIMNHYKNYEVSISETHHIHKKDAPSGTAISLANGIIGERKDKISWSIDSSTSKENIPIESIRKGEIFGDHTVSYVSEADIIQINHSAKNRRGFAHGALIAAGFIADKKGVFSMDDLLKI